MPLHCKWAKKQKTKLKHKTDSDTKGSVLGLEDLKIRGQVKIIQTTSWLRSARILRRVLETFAQSARAVEYTDYFSAEG